MIFSPHFLRRDFGQKRIHKSIPFMKTLKNRKNSKNSALNFQKTNSCKKDAKIGKKKVEKENILKQNSPKRLLKMPEEFTRFET